MCLNFIVIGNVEFTNLLQIDYKARVAKRLIVWPKILLFLLVCRRFSN